MKKESSPLLNRLLTGRPQLNREATKRRKTFNYLTVKRSDVDDFISKGWEMDKELKIKVRLKRPKGIDKQLEDRLWMFFFKVGYPELNEGRKFTVQIKRHNVPPIRKQIDVFAKDDETVVVAECKASTTLGRRSLQKDIEEFANLKGAIANSIKKHFGPSFKPKIIWLFVTENIIWSQPDKIRAAGENIRIVTERELRYYVQISNHIGSAARYQFLAEFLKNQDIPELAEKTVPAIRGKLGGRKFYSFVTTPKDLLKISFVNHRSLNDPGGVPSYQRLVSRTRLRQVAQFINNRGFFPTNILVNFISSVRFDSIKKNKLADVTFGTLYLPNRYRSVWIIDGQHRLYGFTDAEEQHLSQNIVVIAFEKLSREDEANLFVTINHEQKSVPKTLLDDLEGDLKWGSDKPHERIGAIAARLINALNGDVGEAFYNRVVQQGITATEKTCLTIPGLKIGIKRSGLIGKVNRRPKVYLLGPFSGATDQETLERARSAINSYFALIRDNGAVHWQKGRSGFLCTNISIQAYLLLFSALIEYMESSMGVDTKQLRPKEIVLGIDKYLEPVLKFLSGADEVQMERRFKVQYGSGGPREYFYRLCRLVKQNFSSFSPAGMDDWEEEQSEENIAIADKKLKDINIEVQKYRGLYIEVDRASTPGVKSSA
ncbi:MAG: DGQHR domain-containing protein, partial [Acidobacteriota bacterium]|nr:DGQHR domain-containing protein [Acidobacteriota bacterium]